MGVYRDSQYKLAVLARETISVTAAGTPGNFDGATEYDMKDVTRVDFALEMGEDIATDNITFKVLESDTAGGTYTEVSDDKYLPTSDTTRGLTNASSAGFLQSFGVIDTKRYLKIRLTSTTVADDIDVYVTPIKIYEINNFDETGIDGQP